jgi:hypothetical protein
VVFSFGVARRKSHDVDSLSHFFVVEVRVPLCRGDHGVSEHGACVVVITECPSTAPITCRETPLLASIDATECRQS